MPQSGDEKVAGRETSGQNVRSISRREAAQDSILAPPHGAEQSKT